MSESASITLTTIGGPLSGKTFVFREHDTFIFGRDPSCHAHLAPDDMTASRHHFLLEVNPPRARLRDLGSLNGTFVNGVRLGGRAAGETPAQALARGAAEVDLADGDRVQVGATTFLVRVEADAVAHASTTSPPPQPSERLPEIPGYDLVRKLGQGGMGAVYLATRRGDGRPVAVKILLAQMAVTESARAMFLREVAVTRSLSHPAIVRVLDEGAIGSVFYFVMEYYPHGSVDQLLARRGGRLAADETLEVVTSALEGLAHAHRQGFVHRDIKPQNLLLGADGRALLADFGLAKSFVRAGLSGMTATGAVGGTPLFMPREQLVNFKLVRPASDVWGFAATLYFLLTGAAPRDFGAGDDPLQVILRGGFVPIQRRRADVPDGLARVLDRALTEAVEDRYPEADELLQALRVGDAT